MSARRIRFAVCLALVSVVTSWEARAQEQDQNSVAARFAALKWQAGPIDGNLGGIATISVPEGYRFLGRDSAAKFMELTENPSDGREMGVLLSDDASWFVVFEFSEQGYVKDTDRSLDADAILASIREGTEQANEVRRERGWGTMRIVGWQQKPFYEPTTHNLTWAIRGQSDSGTSINHSTRLLGRRGVMNVDLVLAPEDAGTAVPAFNSLLTGFSFNAGQRYAEFRRGDKIAEYGLTGLIVGGAGVALVKTGLLQKFGKLIVLAFVALAGAIKKMLGGIGRSREAANQSSNV